MDFNVTGVTADEFANLETQVANSGGVARHYQYKSLGDKATKSTSYVEAGSLIVSANNAAGIYELVLSGLWSYDHEATRYDSALFYEVGGSETQIGPTFSQPPSSVSGIGVTIEGMNTGTDALMNLYRREIIQIPENCGWTIKLKHKVGRKNKVAAIYNSFLTLELKEVVV